MDPIDTLASEHGLIRQYLDNLTLAVEHLGAGRRPPRAFFERAVEFARSFADSFHHSKEEEVLFVKLAAKRSGELDDRLAALRSEHESSRALVAAIEDALDGYQARVAGAEAGLQNATSDYISLLRHHLWVEDHQVMPVARRSLTRSELFEVEIAFVKARAQHWDNAFERSHRLVVEMGGLLAELDE